VVAEAAGDPAGLEAAGALPAGAVVAPPPPHAAAMRLTAASNETTRGKRAPTCSMRTPPPWPASRGPTERTAWRLRPSWSAPFRRRQRTPASQRTDSAARRIDITGA
jgi:hypothetical protein